MQRGPHLFWVEQPFDGRLAVSSRPLGDQELEVEVAGWRAARLDVIVSMLEPEEAVDLGLGREHQVCADQGLEFINCPIPDHGIPEEPALVIACVDLALARLRAGKRVAAHCFAGMGRSPLLVASIMVRSGLAPDIAWQEVVKARGLRLPDIDAQRRWVADLAAGLHSMPQAGPR